MRSVSSSLFCILAITLLAAGCRDGDEAAPRSGAPAAGAAERSGPPRDSLYGATAVENLRVVPVELELRGVPRGWNGMRVAVVSDLLLGLWPDNANVATAAIRAATEADPDLIVLLGDFVAAGGDPRALDQVLAPLGGRQALAVLGGRDLRDESVATGVSERLRAAGVTVLRNELVAFSRGGDTAFIAGVDPGGAALGAGEAFFAGVEPGAPTPILLTQSPELLPRLPERRFPAVLAGGTFCGNIDIPGTPRLVTLQEETLAADRLRGSGRLFRSRGNTLFVSCGVGYSFVPARVAVAPEVALVTLIRIPEPRGETADTLPPPPDA